MAEPVLAAYRYCETVTGRQARNFAYGIRLLPPGKRRAMSALYALSRRIDDIGDGDLPEAAKRERLEATRALLGRIRAGEIRPDDTDPVAVALTHAAGRYPIPLGAFGELVDGVLMDVRGTAYGTWEDLRTYCRCVAGSVGRLSLGVFGVTDPEGHGAGEAARAPGYADTLGLALQLTNILRDIREDAADGRIYLPTEDLAAFDCLPFPVGPPAGPRGAPAEPGASGDTPGAGAPAAPLVPPAGADFTGLVRFQARRAGSLFTEGLRLLPLLDRRSGACVAAMAGIYRRLLDRIARDPEAVLRGRVSLPAPEKAYVAVRGLSGLDARSVSRRRPVRTGGRCVR
ncbi:squalene/phytoene synthase family protein [Streptomyces zingiberis]|uniref:Squalene/phytoene synthase family protein n=1 Tax=Streptomyces zingiberis TaxID=2053010 RepID=A0ABX1C7J8_9ACTN|nr:squalene/phytoene synthase family protein [Streptomyces zingiberis]NJQ03912.1 squalene/phytoene synthase family protein [Streptomyces zingiberis]